MAIFIIFVLGCAGYLLAKLLVTAPHVDPATQRQQTHSEASIAVAWGALDDLQLTRLLTDSAPRKNDE